MGIRKSVKNLQKSSTETWEGPGEGQQTAAGERGDRGAGAGTENLENYCSDGGRSPGRLPPGQQIQIDRDL